MDFIEFEERGIRFEIQDLAPGLLVLARRPDGSEETATVGDLDAAGRAVDRELAKLPPAADGEGFGGLHLLVWSHEERTESVHSHPTRGSLLSWMEDGSVPSLEEAVSLSEFCGDIVVRVTDNRGRVLMEEPDKVSDLLAMLARIP